MQMTFVFPDVTEAARLFALHRHAMAESAPFSERVELTRLEPVERLTRAFAEEIKSLTERGLYRRQLVDGRFKMTLRAAFLMVWRTLWPLGLYLKWRQSARARALLKRWEPSFL